MFDACSIRLSRQANPVLERLAEKIVATTTGPAHSAEDIPEATGLSPFRFLNLPTEVRHHILTYTDLVTPS